MWPFRFIHLLLAASLFLSSLAAALEEGQVFQAEDSKRYRLERRLGSGDFGEVWEAKQIGSSRTYALKFYFDEDDATQNTKKVARLLGRMTRRPNILTVFPPQTYTDVEEGSGFKVIRSELGAGSVQGLAEAKFRLDQPRSKIETGRRIGNLSRLISDGVAGLSQLHKLGFVHHDPNPRNILLVGNRFKLSDLDGVTPVGRLPPVGAYEFFYGAIEYENDDHVKKSGPVADYFALASTTFFLMTGKSPLEGFAEKYWKDNIRNARQALFDSAASRAEFETFVRSELTRVFNHSEISTRAAKPFQNIFKFLTAALTVDAKERKKALIEWKPELAEAWAKVKPRSLVVRARQPKQEPTQSLPKEKPLQPEVPKQIEAPKVEVPKVEASVPAKIVPPEISIVRPPLEPVVLQPAAPTKYEHERLPSEPNPPSRNVCAITFRKLVTYLEYSIAGGAAYQAFRYFKPARFGENSKDQNSPNRH